VLTKVDAFNLESVIGDAALSPSLTGLERETARNQLISRRLREWGMVPLVEIIESRFSKRGFFTCSAVGLRRRPGDGFVPERIASPFLWLMHQGKTGLLADDVATALASKSVGSAPVVAEPTTATRQRSAEYYSLLCHAVAQLKTNTYSARGTLYDRARQTLLKQLVSLTPALSESEIEREQLALEEAITRIETSVIE
jgi:hypothetical protein